MHAARAYGRTHVCTHASASLPPHAAPTAPRTEQLGASTARAIELKAKKAGLQKMLDLAVNNSHQMDGARSPTVTAPAEDSQGRGGAADPDAQLQVVPRDHFFEPGRLSDATEHQ